jgi:hypothetical protein
MAAELSATYQTAEEYCQDVKPLKVSVFWLKLRKGQILFKAVVDRKRLENQPAPHLTLPNPLHDVTILFT